ncbi:hypothetical protein IH799_01320 [candidate division KSB1 bacterium]|nr:hypothetical protein [candidate division KSB1 bacterium]
MLNKNFFFGLLTILVCTVSIALNYSDIFTKEDVKQITFTGKEDHSISLEDASKMTRNFQLQSASDQIIGGFFGKDAVLAIISQEGAVGLRYYYGLDDEGTPHIILIGVEADGNDMIDGLLAERAAACPPHCPEFNDLNSPLVNEDLAANL